MDFSRIVRAKRVDTQEWDYGYYVPPILEEDEDKPVEGNLPDYKEYGGIIPLKNLIISRPEYELQPVLVLEDTVQRCSGLRDKNKTLIFEGDIIELETDNPMHKIRYEIQFSDYFGILLPVDARTGYLFTDCISFSRSKAEKYTVIGNKIDNPELLREV